MSLRTLLASLLTLALVAPAAGCQIGGINGNDGGGGGDGDGDVPPPPAPPQPPPPEQPPPPPQPAVYTRGSLKPIVKLMPSDQYGKVAVKGLNSDPDSAPVPMDDTDFELSRTDGDGLPVGGLGVSAEQKLQEVGAQIGVERGLPPVDLLRGDTRPRDIPFRGKPSDVKHVDIGTTTKVVVTLPGLFGFVGNEVSIVDLAGGEPARVRVGVRPKAVAVHPSGLAFVCNQYSNYISVVDLKNERLLLDANGVAVEIPSEYYCSDIEIVPRNTSVQDENEIDIYVANEWRASVLKYSVSVVESSITGEPIDVVIVNPASPNPANQPAAEILGVGSNPRKLTVSNQQDAIYVWNSRGGEAARIQLNNQSVNRVALGAPTMDGVQIGQRLFIGTTMPDRGLVSADDAALIQNQPNIITDPVPVKGIDNLDYIGSPGSMTDNTQRMNFEAVANGVFEVNASLNGLPLYYADAVSSEPSFVDDQKVLSGAIPEAVAAAVVPVGGQNVSSLFLAHNGSDKVQQLEVESGSGFRLAPIGDFETQEMPTAIAVNVERNELYVVGWGEELEVFDLTTRARLDDFDLGYAAPAYPATNIERGEYFFSNADWSNNGAKTCKTCHLDDQLADGIGFFNGTSAFTMYKQVPANFNQLETEGYFWNGSMPNGNYTSLAFAAQSRTNCELVLFGLTEGVSVAPELRVGDLNNRVTDGNDAACRPIIGNINQLPTNFAEIAQVIAAQKQVAAQLIQDETGFTRDEVARFINFYDVAYIRLPANPLAQMRANGELDPEVAASIQRGQELFTGKADCNRCHTAPLFADKKEHGLGATWRKEFADLYDNDARVINLLGAGGLPQVFKQSVEDSTGSVVDREINVYAPNDYFTPFCFSTESCLVFEDPIAVRGNRELETQRLETIIAINIADPEREFMPGNPVGQIAVNTPSLRGLWWRNNYLHHGLAFSLAETFLAPGHPALEPGVTGWAVDSGNKFDNHGTTSGLSKEEVDDLILYLESIE